MCRVWGLCGDGGRRVAQVPTSGSHCLQGPTAPSSLGVPCILERDGGLGRLGLGCAYYSLGSGENRPSVSAPLLGTTVSFVDPL
jgi:hypothetical protein